MKAKQLLVLTLTAIISSPLFSQTTIGNQKVDQYPVSAAGALTYGLTYLPADYNPANKYPLIIFLHGMGEGGDGVSGLYNLLNQGLPWWINRGFKPSAVSPVDGKTYEFIVVSPQAPASWQWSYDYNEIQYVVPDILNRYSIDQSRMYVTGLSAGGSGTWSCMTHDPNFAMKFAAIMPNSDAGFNNTPLEAPFLHDITSVYGVPVWCVDGALDGLHGHTTLYLDTINAGPPIANPQGVQTLIDGAGHSAAAWDSAYSPTWRNNQFNQTAYEWFLRYKRASNGISPLTAYAGTNQTLSVPASSTNLSGSATPSTGSSIASYGWTEISGPSNAAISSAGSASTGISALIPGTYTFQLTVKDNSGATATSTMTITVNSLLNIIVPTVNAGVNQTITLPTSSINLAGVIIGNGAAILSTSWTQTSGPNTATITNTWSTLTPVTGLVAGTYTFQLSVSVAGIAAVTANVTVTVNSSAPQSIAAVPGPGGYTTIPGTVQAENYVTMSGVQTETTIDAGGGLDVGWIDQGDWMNYNVNALAAGTYTVGFRVATTLNGGTLQLKDASGNVLANVNVPNTGNWEGWQTVTATVTLPAGNQTIQVYNNGFPGWNINWISFTGLVLNTASAGTSIPGTIQAESYATMFGVQTEQTIDAGGGLDVGWIDQGDWMNYNVTVAATGTYTVGFRVATTLNGGTLQLKDASGNVLANVNVPNTGNWEGWQTVTATVTLPAGNQTLQLVNNGFPGWNINWMDFESTGVAATSSGMTIPGLIQAEDFSTMSGVQTEQTLDAGGGLDVGWIDQGDWMNYNVNVVAAGTYTVGFRIATTLNGGTLQLKDAAGNVLTTVNVPATGNWEAWQTVTASVNLPAGSQTLQLYNNGFPGWNINWIDFGNGLASAAQQPTVMGAQAAVLSNGLAGSTTPYLTLYPNPARDHAMIDINNPRTGKMIIQVISQSGQIIKTYSSTKTGSSIATQLFTGDLASGVYSIRIQIGDWTDIRKLVKL
jgi:Carbohydrate binding module (family 6)/Secretion system C-terminal sorting domain